MSKGRTIDEISEEDERCNREGRVVVYAITRKRGRSVYARTEVDRALFEARHVGAHVGALVLADLRTALEVLK
jgi:hypothetical protein